MRSFFGALSDPRHELGERDALLTLAEESAGIGVWDIDLTAGTARGTAQFFRIMGLEPTVDPVPMERIRGLRHPDDRDRVIAGFQHALDTATDAYEMEYRIVRPDGEVRWIFGRGRVVRDAGGKPVRYSGVDIDITERKRAEAALAEAKEALERMNQELEARVRSRTAELEAEAKRRVEAEARLHQAQKMEAVGQLTGGVAHDFNNILQVILGNLEVVRRLAPASEPVLRGCIDAALQATQTAAQLTHRLLAFSRLQPLEPAVLDVNALIAEMAELIRHTLGETIVVDTRLADGLWPTFADRNQLESALLNLVVNARDAMPEGGHLALETGNVGIAPGDGDDVPPGEYVVLSVADTGCGIPQALLAKVFEPFFTTKETGKGSGLGLSMVYGFVKQSGGQVRIHSVESAGTTVRMYLPRSEALPERKPAPAAAPAALPGARAGETVLVVEDNPAVRRHGVNALESFGYRVIEAPDGATALALLDAPDAPRVDLLFTDVVLPNGMSGRELADAVRARRGVGLPVLFTTGYARDAIVHNGRLDPDVRLLGKPYNLESLAKSVRQAIDRG